MYIDDFYGEMGGINVGIVFDCFVVVWMLGSLFVCLLQDVEFLVINDF